MEKITKLLERVEQLDRELFSFLDEPGRGTRLASVINRKSANHSNTSLPLLGKFFGLKDIFHYDGLPTAAGSNVPVEILKGEQGKCFRMLEEAGAIMFGKTATTEFAYFEPSNTRNPWNLNHTPGGSSSGSAAAVAAGLCDFAVGTQTVGSIIRPAAYCGVVGFKPSFGRVDTSGLIYFSPSVDAIGFFSRSVKSVRDVAAVVCSDWRDVQKTKDIKKNVRIGIPSGKFFQQCSEEGRDLFNSQIDIIKSAGFSVREIDVFSDIATINSNHRTLIAYEIARVHSDWYQSYKLSYRPMTAAIIEEGMAIKPSEVKLIREERLRRYNNYESFMDEHRIEIWLSPSAVGPAPLGLRNTGDPCMNLPWSYLGVPALNIPVATFSNGLPAGIQCTARFGADEELIAWGAELYEVFPTISRNQDG